LLLRRSALLLLRQPSATASIWDCVQAHAGVAALVGLLATGGPVAVHEQAAAALANIYCDVSRNWDSIWSCAGIAALVGVLAPGSSRSI